MTAGRRLTVLLLAIACVSPAAAIGAGEFDEFGIDSVDVAETTGAAGSHPDFTTKLVLNHHFESGRPVSSARVQEIVVELPPGLVGDPTAYPTCSMGEFNAIGNCPTDSQVGVVQALISELGLGEELTTPLFNLEVPHPGEEVAKLGFFAGIFPITLDVSVRSASDYGVTATVRNASGLAPLISATTTLWGVPGDPVHDEQRLTTVESLNCTTACNAPGGKRSSSLPGVPFLTNPSACQPMGVSFAASSYQLPGRLFTAQASMAATTGCGAVPFAPTMDVEPTSRVAGAPTGLRTTLRIPQIAADDQPASSAMRIAKVTLPAGMGISPGAVYGIGTCSDQQVGLGQEVPSECPAASKVGEAKIVSPSLAGPVNGGVYVRDPTPGNQFRLWLAADAFGMHVKLPGEIHADPRTGRLTAEFRETPQVPVEEIELEIWGGDRAPLKNPDRCGTYATTYELTPWSGSSPVAGKSLMAIDQGCGKGFDPRLEAGVTNPVAGAFSPLIVNLFRDDGGENVGGLEIDLPKGLLAKLRGVPLCPDSAAETGSCPPDSRIGSIAASIGSGQLPLWLPQPGKEPTGVYLSGPYQDAPFSLVVEVPAQAGPFDLGTVVVRPRLQVDPETGQASVEANPLPQFVEGVAVTYRALHVRVDRASFVLNPTSCEEKSFRSTVTSTGGAAAHPSSLFQVGRCKALRFSPRLSLKLRGGAARGDYPALTAVLKAKKGQANIRKVSVALPRSEFLAQEHIETICTRVQFGAGKCPKRAIYGYAKAWTPLLDKPLTGPVYLRSSDHQLPDLVAALDGQLDIDLVGRIDSHNGGIRTTFSSVPDAPVSRFVLKMKGGDKGLLSNSRDICRAGGRAAVRMNAQNGRVQDFNAPLNVQCGQSKRK
jgi:hypothetical protein